MITTIIDILTAIIAPLITGVSGYVYGNRKRIKKQANRIDKLEQRLFGLNDDETDKGFLYQQQEEMRDIKSSIDRIEDKIDNIDD
jgi:uncharacterized protein HemX